MSTDSKLERLKVQRSVIESQQLRAQEFLEKYASSATLEALQVRLNHVEVQFKTFNVVQASIEEIDIEELKEDNRQRFEESYFTLQPALVTLIQKCRPSSSPRKESNDSDSLQDNLVRLPKISLPTFSGEITEWTSYFESFNVLIHEQPSLNELQKYQYLKSSLIGPAAAQIASLELTAKNYSVAIEILKEKYQNKRSICLAHLDTLLNIRPLLSSKPQDVRKQTDTIKVQLRALETLGRPVSNWDDILVHLIVSKLDAVLRSSWEDEVPAKRLPSLNELMIFLERKCDKLEATYRAQSLTNTTKDHSLPPSRKAKNSFIAASNVHCPICNKNRHLIYHCPVFLKLPVRERLSMIQKLKLCSNCLRHGHGNDACRSTYKCRICQVRHHSLLHPDTMIASTSKEQLQSNISLHLTSLPRERSYVFIATAVIQILDIHGNHHQCRAVLDSASQVNFISSRLTTLLGLKKRRTLTPISGIGNTQNIEAKHQTATVIKSRFNNFSAQLNAIVLPTISNIQPSSYIEVSSWNIPVNIELADPNFNKPDHIDLLIGAELHYQLLQVGQISLSEDAPVLQKTLFGWIVSGKANLKPLHQPTPYSCNLTTNPLYHTDAITHELRQFWELENHLQNKPQRSLEERLCESHFLENVERDTKGHFMVKLPFKEDPTCLGDSKDMAIRRFLTLERKLHKNLHLLKEYKGFIHEYLQLGHMEEINTLPSSNYFLPHHCVIKPESSTTKLRVVFDGSAKTTSNQCLNDILMVGPVVQQDLFAILLRFRSHRYVITADISKMYRQVRVDPSQRRYQMIVWRDSPSQQLKYFQLSTVTYGTASAPFLATRCLLQLTSDEEKNFPLGSAIASKDFYVDDLLTGGNTLTDVRNIKIQVSALLQKGGFLLRKWCSNHLELLSDIPEEEREQYLQFQDGAAVKTLGLIWQPEADKFQFAANIHSTEIKNITKRSVLSDIAKLFDLLGLINPIILLGKIFMQQL